MAHASLACPSSVTKWPHLCVAEAITCNTQMTVLLVNNLPVNNPLCVLLQTGLQSGWFGNPGEVHQKWNRFPVVEGSVV